MNEWIGQVLPFWKDLTETEKQMLLTHTALEEYEKGVLLHIDGGDCAGVQIVKEGQVRVYITSPSGGEITLYRLVEGDVSILSASCMIKGMDISLDMMMESDTVLYTIPKEIYKKLNDTNTAVKDYTMEMVSERFSDVMWLFNQYVFSNCSVSSGRGNPGTYGTGGRGEIFYYSRCTCKRYGNGKRSRHKTAQAVSDRRVCEIIPRLYRSTGCKSSEKNMRNVILSRKKHKKVVY